ncbi:hypothetical protein C8Q77DRAFT_926148 [Trametes polyzona]|nr:hypothetical protein C8Q77DRAFT_926148 [Trametes polyzona]
MRCRSHVDVHILFPVRAHRAMPPRPIAIRMLIAPIPGVPVRPAHPPRMRTVSGPGSHRGAALINHLDYSNLTVGTRPSASQRRPRCRDELAVRGGEVWETVGPAVRVGQLCFIALRNGNNSVSFSGVCCPTEQLAAIIPRPRGPRFAPAHASASIRRPTLLQPSRVSGLEVRQSHTPPAPQTLPPPAAFRLRLRLHLPKPSHRAVTPTVEPYGHTAKHPVPS